MLIKFIKIPATKLLLPVRCLSTITRCVSKIITTTTTTKYIKQKDHKAKRITEWRPTNECRIQDNLWPIDYRLSTIDLFESAHRDFNRNGGTKKKPEDRIAWKKIVEVLLWDHESFQNEFFYHQNSARSFFFLFSSTSLEANFEQDQRWKKRPINETNK